MAGPGPLPHLVSLKALGRWAVRHKHIARSPFEQATIVVPRKTRNRETRAFTTEEMQIILSAATKITTEATIKSTAQAARRWVPWICAYTGARAGEITQLRCKDVTERDGIKIIRITPEAGTNKTKQARAVPVHEHLIAQGLLEYVNARRAGPLFYAPQGPPRDSKRQAPATSPSQDDHGPSTCVSAWASGYDRSGSLIQRWALLMLEAHVQADS
jgi:integrase